MALARARFCELAANSDRVRPVGAIPPRVVQPLARHAPDSHGAGHLHPCAISDQIRFALLGEKIPERSLLCWIEASEGGNWSTCDAVKRFHQLTDSHLAQIAADSAAWADENLKFSA